MNQTPRSALPALVLASVDVAVGALLFWLDAPHLAVLLAAVGGTLLIGAAHETLRDAVRIPELPHGG